MFPEEVPRDDMLGGHYRKIIEQHNLPSERISTFFYRAIQLYWYLLGGQGDVADVKIFVEYDPDEDTLKMSLDLPSSFYAPEGRDLTINMEEFSANCPDHIRTELILEISDENYGEDTERIAMDATFFNIGQMFFPCELILQIDHDEKNTYYLLKYGRNGMIYMIEAMDPELYSLMGDDSLDEINVLILVDPRDFPTAIDYINNQFEGPAAEDPSECPPIQEDRPLDILYTLTCLARERQYRVAPNGAKVPQLIYQ